MLTIGRLNDLAPMRHGFFCRTGGVSEGLYTSLNCGYGSGDKAENVTENRRRAMAEIDLEGGRLVTAYQVHSPDVVEVKSVWAREDSPQADAMVTRERGLALGILTADCVPVLFADAQAGVVGAAHAGWKGAFSGILEATIAEMEKRGAQRNRIAAAVGPCISFDAYEVGPEFHGNFMDADPGNAEWFQPSARDGHFMFDLPGYVEARLHKADLASVAVTGHCTYQEEKRFFSYRRAVHRKEKDYGRQISTIMLRPAD